MGYWLPFCTFGEAAAFDLEVEVTCRCRRCVVVDAAAVAMRDRRIMGARFKCTTLLPHGEPCAGTPSLLIRRRGTAGMTVPDHSSALRARQRANPVRVVRGSFGEMVARGEIAFLYDQACVPGYTVAMIAFDLSPWDRFLGKPWGDFLCPGCRRPLKMHCHKGAGTPATERFGEAS
jgi:hypothetical protein